MDYNLETHSLDVEIQNHANEPTENSSVHIVP